MKTSLDHLPEKKQHQVRALGELIRKEAEVEMVILFGSFARGDWVEDPVGGYFSDLDVLVIVKSPSMVDKVKLWSKIEDRARRITKPTSLSLLVHDIKDVNEQLEKGFYFFSDIKKEGIMIYDSGQFHLAEPKERSLAERKAHAQAWFEQWFESSNDFYRSEIRDHERGARGHRRPRARAAEPGRNGLPGAHRGDGGGNAGLRARFGEQVKSCPRCQAD